jgi:hypothetical protein
LLDNVNDAWAMPISQRWLCIEWTVMYGLTRKAICDKVETGSRRYAEKTVQRIVKRWWMNDTVKPDYRGSRQTRKAATARWSSPTACGRSRAAPPCTLPPCGAR